MTKRLSSKLLSVILTLAICATTVFGCLMTVSAEDSWVTFSAGETTNNELTEATIKLTVNLPASAEGFTATENDKTYGGIVTGTVALDYDSNLTLKAVKVDGGTKVDTAYNFDADEFAINFSESDSNNFVFEASNTDNVYYSQLTFELSFTLTGAENGDKFSVTASSVEIGGALGGTYGPTAVTGAIVAGCAHELVVDDADLIQTDTVNGYAVYSDSVCSECGLNFGKQVVPTRLPGTTIYWDGTTVTLPTKTDGDGNTLITSAAELAYITSNTVTGNYKVADGIDAIVLQGETYSEGIMALADYAETQVYFEDTTKITPAVWKNEGAFQGTFDGNGATIYGMYSNGERGGLFGTVYESTVIKNISVKNSYMDATKSAGALASCYAASSAFLSKEVTSTTGTTYKFGDLINLSANRPTDYWDLIAAHSTGMLTFDKCVVSGCYISSDAVNSTYSSTGAGVWLGTGYACLNLTASNMLVHSNKALSKGIEQGITGLLSTKHTIPRADLGNPLNNTDIKNCIILDCVPYTVYDTELNNQAYMPQDFTNVYTNTEITFNPCTNSKIENYNGVFNKIDADDLKGDAAQSIVETLNTANGETVWEADANRGYPKFIQAETPDLVNETSDFELTLIGTNITYNNGGDYNYNFYYRPDKSETGNNYTPDLYVAQLNKDNTTLGSFHHLTGEALSADAAAAVDKDKLQEGDIRFTIERLSAREIYNTLLATAVAVKDGKAVWGDTDEFSIAEYENAIINGNYDTADKNLAEAVLKYGRASEAALNTKNDAASGTTIYWDGSVATKFYTDDQGTSAADPIIINTAAEFAYLTSKALHADTVGKYFKMADGIDKVVLQNEEHGKKIVELDSADAVKEYFEAELEKDNATFIRWVSRTWNPSNTCFAGHFDGNGVEFYGMYNTTGDINTKYSSDANSAGGLFSVAEDASFSNLAVKNSYSNIGLGGLSGNNTTNWNFGLIVSYGKDEVDASYSDGLTFDRCTVSNNYIRKIVRKTLDSMILSGIVLGNNYNGPVVMNNLLVCGNVTEGYVNTNYYTWDGAEPYDMPVVGGVSNSGDISITNSVMLDDVALVAAYPDGTLLGNWKTLQCRSDSDKIDNVYTDWDLTGITSSSSFDKDYFTSSSGNKIISKADAMGVAAMTNMPNLDWTNTWCYGTTYPSLAKGTYSTSSSEGKTIYWNGTAASKFYGETDGASANNPIIIDTAEKLAYVATATYDNTVGKYFKIADGIDKIVLQSETYCEGIIACNSSEAVRDYFESTIASNNKAFYRWASRGWKSTTLCFAGNFDGNGVEIYGMYNTTGDRNTYFSGETNGAGGLFSVADGATISNLAIKNSYTNLGNGSNTHTNWSFGLIVSFGKDKDSDSEGTKNIVNDAIIINNCTIANNYIRKNVGDSFMWRAGTVCGSHQAGAFILQNCLVYGNDAMGHLTTADVDYKLGLVGGADNKFTAPSDYAAAHSDWVDGEGIMETVLENSVVLGTPLFATNLEGTAIKNLTARVLTTINKENNCLKNVYTDWNLIAHSNFNIDYFLNNCGGVVTESDLIGNTAKANEIVGKFNADNTANGNDAVWYTGNSALVGFNPPTEMIGSAQAVYDAITFTTADNYGDNDKTFGVYATSLNLKTNPYISFAFAFSGEYKSNRDKIEVTFTYNGGSKTVKVAENGALLDGWSNASNDRFHIYRFEDIPVEALGSPITVTVAYNGTEKVTNGTFSVEGFGLELLNAYKQAPSKYYETRIEAVKALLFYTQMLQARYGAQA